ncbi:MAG: hypothetical protein ACNA8W_00200 [Bradymonadaceae bacterium]
MDTEALTKTTEALTEFVGDAQVAGIEVKTLIGVLAAGAAIFAAGVKFGYEIDKDKDHHQNANT